MKPLAFPKPESDAELEIVSELYFGVPLHLARLEIHRGAHGGTSGSYEVQEDFDSYGYDQKPDLIDCYDYSDEFWAWVVGDLSWGGTARASYGQFRCGYRQRRRLERWISGRRSGGSSSVRPAFAKVSRAITGSERTPQTMDRGVL